jgi:hypothetical protein
MTASRHSDQEPSADVIVAVYGEARDDLHRLMSPAREAVAQYGQIRGSVELTSALLRDPSWDRMMVASVLGVALAKLVVAEGRE